MLLQDVQGHLPSTTCSSLAQLRTTATWHHLDRALEKASVGAHAYDADGLMDWLTERKYDHRLQSFRDTDTQGCLTRIFYEVEGAR